MIGMFTDESGRGLPRLRRAIQRRRVINFSCQWPVASSSVVISLLLTWGGTDHINSGFGSTVSARQLATGGCNWQLFYPNISFYFSQ